MNEGGAGKASAAGYGGDVDGCEEDGMWSSVLDLLLVLEGILSDGLPSSKELWYPLSFSLSFPFSRSAVASSCGL